MTSGREVTRRRFLTTAAAAGAGIGASHRYLACAAAQAPTPIPIEHLVIILRENHSYDNYFGTYPGGNGKTAGLRCEDERPDPPHLRQHALQGVTVGVRGYCHHR